MNWGSAAGLALLLASCPALPRPSETSATAHAVEIARVAAELQPKLVGIRRDLHEHPELANRETRTASMICARLRALGLDDIRTDVAHTGVVALLRGGLPGPTVAARADMDALPINETLDVPYRSLTPGVKHACGHDAHTAILLGVAEVLHQLREQVHGNVKFIFQPAEEGAPPGEQGGAELMVKEGVLEDPTPLAIFGLHVTPEIETGDVGWRAGAAQAAADVFEVQIKGKPSYGATPEKGVDSILVAAECVTALQSIKSRRLDAFAPVLLTIGSIHGGDKPHTIAAEVKLKGTVRCFNESVSQRVEELMRQTVAGVTSAYGATFELKYRRLTLVVDNDPKLVEAALPSLRRAVGPNHVLEAPLRMGAEDFSFYQAKIPGFFVRLGCGNKAKGINADTHTPEFDLDERCIEVGVRVLANELLDFGQAHSE